MALLFLIAATAMGDEASPALKVGDQIPISSMRVLFGQGVGRNTCLAGRNRDRRAISVYASSLEEPGLKELVKKLEELAAAEEKLAAYVLLTKGDQFDTALSTKAQGWANSSGLDRVDIAVANGLPTRLGLSPTAAITVICSDKRKIEFRAEYESGKLDEAARTELGEALAKLSKGE